MIIPVGPARNLASQAAFSSLVGLPLRSMLGKKYKPSPRKEARSVETMRSSSDMRVKPIPLSNTMCEMPPHTNMVAAPPSVAISHLYKNFIWSQSRIVEHTKFSSCSKIEHRVHAEAVGPHAKASPPERVLHCDFGLLAHHRSCRASAVAVEDRREIGYRLEKSRIACF